MKIEMNKLVRRQTKSSRFSYFSGTDRELIMLVEQSFPLRKPGLREGTFIIPVQAVVDGKTLFHTPIIKLLPGSRCHADYISRTKEDELRLSVTVYATGKSPAKSVEVVVWTRELLQKHDKNSSDADFEIMSINASPDDLKVPYHPYELLRAYRDDPQFFSKQTSISEVMRSIDYWSQHGFIRAPKKQSYLETIDSEVIQLVMEGNKLDAMKKLRLKGAMDADQAAKVVNRVEEELAEKR